MLISCIAYWISAQADWVQELKVIGDGQVYGGPRSACWVWWCRLGRRKVQQPL
jgi:hypothetical protein